MGESERQGRLPAGWQQQGLSLPISLRKTLAAEARSKGQGGIKLIGTAAIGAILGIPEGSRHRFLMKITELSWKKDLADIEPAEYFRILMESLEEDIFAEDSSEPMWEVTRILDPELTPPPGKKQSDRDKSRKRGSA